MSLVTDPSDQPNAPGAPTTAAPAAVIAAVVIVRNESDLTSVLDAVAGQVYGVSACFVVGGDERIRAQAEARRCIWSSTIREVSNRLTTAIDYAWLVHDNARPRPGALSALVTEARRVDASIVGSKLLNLENPELLESIGVATDVFEVPYTGLDQTEMDQQQYEVVRDVAAVPAASLLVRRDLLRGLGGPDPLLAPEAAVVDFCQRARLRGARIVVVPTSDVLYPALLRRGTAPWQEEASRIRAMMKSYSILTLLWVLPLAFLSQLLEAIVAPLLGRWTLWVMIRAWAWNVYRIPSTIGNRIRARRGRTNGDSELFRYQVRGSVRLRQVGNEVADRIRERIPEAGEGVSGLVEAGQQTVRSPGFLAAAGATFFVFLATRSIWAGTLPAVGYTLPPSASAADTLAAYAGGWNVAGLGSPEPLPPAVGAIALIQWLLLGKAELTAAVVTVAALIAGAVGMARLLRHFGLRSVTAYLGGVVMVAGPAAHAIGQQTDWTVLLGLGVLPWVIRVALRPWPESWRGRAGRVAAAAWLTAAAAIGLPIFLVVPLVAVLLWGLIGEGVRWHAPLIAAAGALIAIPILLPWFGVVDLSTYLEDGAPAYWEIYWLTAIVVAVAAIAVLAGGERVLGSVAAWGGTLAVLGVVVARSGTWDFGRNVEAMGMAIAALGLGAITGAATESAARFEVVKAWRRFVTAAGIIAGGLLVVSTVTVLLPGRAGLPGDVYRNAFGFTEAQVENPEDSRILVAGPPEALPGDSRLIAGAAYRVVSAPLPRLWEAKLGNSRLGDGALESTLQDLVAGEVARAGEALAPFGIRWVVLLGETPFSDVFEGQLDLIPLQSLADTVFLSEIEATRAVSSSDPAWRYVGPSYARDGTASSSQVFLAENADQRWGPGQWEQVDWGNALTTDAAEAGFSAHGPYRREAWTALILAVVLIVIAVVGTGKKAK